jgi:hypothetical protein
VKARGNKLVDVTMVEHPGGHDGGDFPCEESFELVQGEVVYSYGLPDSPTDTFCDEDPEDYNNCPTKEDAINRLTVERARLRSTLEVLERTLDTLQAGASYKTVCMNDEDGEEDEYEDEHDESDEDE